MPIDRKPEFFKGAQSNRRQQDEKRSALRQVLVHAEQIDHSRHQNDAAPDTQEAHQHTNAKSQQKNHEYHGDRTALCVSFR